MAVGVVEAQYFPTIPASVSFCSRFGTLHLLSRFWPGADGFSAAAYKSETFLPENGRTEARTPLTAVMPWWKANYRENIIKGIKSTNRLQHKMLFWWIRGDFHLHLCIMQSCHGQWVLEGGHLKSNCSIRVLHWFLSEGMGDRKPSKKMMTNDFLRRILSIVRGKTK